MERKIHGDGRSEHNQQGQCSEAAIPCSGDRKKQCRNREFGGNQHDGAYTRKSSGHTEFDEAVTRSGSCG
jgi:hypothetical protein